LWAMLVFFLNFIPSIGLILAAVPAVLFSLIELSTVQTVLVVLSYVVVNALVDFVIQPRFLASQIDLSKLTIILSLFFWGWVLGPFGMFLAIPLTIMCKYTIALVRESF
ncbi:unnamed protein product, partial [marine sediment metagenome]